ncbi:MAG: ABC transporter substrate-binding protein [Treponema sp.]|nr:ABC transporter substrate-binding protein [Treponema sp.]
MKRVSMKQVVVASLMSVLVAGFAFAAEAPELAALVKAGKLPPLEKRIPGPSDVFVSKADSVGTYGDALRFTSFGGNSRWTVGKLTEEPLFRYRLDGTVEPNVAKGFDRNKDSTVYTIYLRKGMRWSDGEPFTADDVVFYYNDMCVPKTFGKSLYDCFYSTNPTTGKKTPCKVEKVDDYTVKVTFADTNTTFLEALTNDSKWFFAPKHYYKKLLPAYIGEEAAKAKAKQMGYSDVKAMGKQTGYYYWTVLGRPTLRAWVAKNDIEDNLYVLERNPYYWKVDTKGNQLPYMNSLKWVKVSDQEQVKLKVLAGDVDFCKMPLADYTVLKQGSKKAGIEMYTWSQTSWASRPTVVQLNQTIKNPKYRAVFQNPDFRQALSICVDRNEVSELVTDGFGEPAQASVPEGLMGYDPNWTRKWTEYNVKKANQLLDSVGLSKKDKNGYRMFDDGTPFVLDMQLTDIEDIKESEKTAELLTKYYGAVGIKTTTKTYGRDLMTEMCNANNHTVLVGPMNSINSFNPILRPNGIIPLGIYSPWSGAYGEYIATKGASGVKPEGDVAKLIDLYGKAKSSTTQQEMEKNLKEIFKLHEKNIWEIGYCAVSPALIVKNTRLQNIGKTLIFCEEYRDLGVAHIENAYLK